MNDTGISASGIQFTIFETLCKVIIVDYFCGQIGVWRSWLAHLHGVQGVVCSSQITPTGFAKIQKTQVYSFVYSRKTNKTHCTPFYFACLQKPVIMTTFGQS